MSNDRSPGVGPVTWVTLGLLVFSWVALVAALVRASWIAGWTGVGMRAELAALALIPHLLWAYVAWRGRRLRPVAAVALLFGIAFGYIGLQLALLLLDPLLNREARLALQAMRFNPGGLNMRPYPFWSVAGGTGLPVALMVLWTTRRKPFVA